MAQLEPYEKIFVDYDFIDEDVHGQLACEVCHGGNPAATDREEAHEGVRKDPTFPDATETCGACHADEEAHPEIAAMNAANPHVTLEPFKRKMALRANPEHLGTIEKAMGNHCLTCHSSCGQCHVSRPQSVAGGLIDGHLFQKTPPVETNCTSCHGSRVGKEYFGENKGVAADVHHTQKRMVCKECHTGDEMHGSDQPYLDRYDVANRAACADCHAPAGTEDADAMRGKPLEHESHLIHRDKVSCQVCHSLAYKNCYSCHVGKDKIGAPYFKTEPSTMDFKIGRNPHPTQGRPEEYVTVRHIPVSPGLFDYYVKDALTAVAAAPTWKMATPHNIQLKTPQNADCLACHDNPEIFLNENDATSWEVAANRDVFISDRKPLHERHDWLDHARLHLENIDCLVCHDPSRQEPLRDCSRCHVLDSMLMVTASGPPNYSLFNWNFTNDELVAKGMYITGCTRIPALDTAGVLLLLLTLAGCTLHGLLRFITSRRKPEDG